MSSASLILSFTVQVKSCDIQLQNLIIGNMYTCTQSTLQILKKKKLYPVRPDKHFIDNSNLIISPCTSHYFLLLFICQVLGKSTFILTNTHNMTNQDKWHLKMALL